MAAADKARFYLEKSVPELQELQQKGVFEQDEITAIVKKRSDFEHTLNGAGSKPTDYLRYVAFEMNLDALRKKRCTRLGVNSTTFTGQKAIFKILDRATKKFPGDKKLWRQFIDYCEQEHANKKLAKVFTSALRLAPRDWALWIMAAKHYAEAEGDMTRARDYLQRALRFNPEEQALYLGFARLELIYLTKLSARRKILGLDEEKPAEAQDGDVEDTIALPAITANDLATPEEKALSHLSTANLKRLTEAPLMQGALPIAVFDAALLKFKHDPLVIEKFFRLGLEFDVNEPVLRFREHVLSALDDITPATPEHYTCRALQCAADISPQSADYALALGQMLQELKLGMTQLSAAKASILQAKAALLLASILQQHSDLDEDLAMVIVSSVRSFVRQLATSLRDVDRTLQQHNTYDANVASVLDLCTDFDRG